MLQVRKKRKIISRVDTAQDYLVEVYRGKFGAGKTTIGRTVDNRGDVTDNGRELSRRRRGNG